MRCSVLKQNYKNKDNDIQSDLLGYLELKQAKLLNTLEKTLSEKTLTFPMPGSTNLPVTNGSRIKKELTSALNRYGHTKVFCNAIFETA